MDEGAPTRTPEDRGQDDELRDRLRQHRAVRRPEPACDLARAAEQAGFESIWTVDHVVVPAGYRSTYPYDPSGRLPSGEDAPFPDPLIWLAYVARATSTIRLATGILILPQRNPPGPGQGVGHPRPPLVGPGHPRGGHRLAEGGVRGPGHPLRGAWSTNRGGHRGHAGAVVAGPRHHGGRHGVFLRRLPATSAGGGTIPIHVGGHTEVAADRAGRIGDGFFPFGIAPDESPISSTR